MKLCRQSTKLSVMSLGSLSSKRLLQLPPTLRVVAVSSARPFSVLNRPPPNYEGHVPLNIPERAALAVGSAVMSLLDPRRGGRNDPISLEIFSSLIY